MTINSNLPTENLTPSIKELQDIREKHKNNFEEFAENRGLKDKQRRLQEIHKKTHKYTKDEEETKIVKEICSVLTSILDKKVIDVNKSMYIKEDKLSSKDKQDTWFRYDTDNIRNNYADILSKFPQKQADNVTSALNLATALSRAKEPIRYIEPKETIPDPDSDPLELEPASYATKTDAKPKTKIVLSNKNPRYPERKEPKIYLAKDKHIDTSKTPMIDYRHATFIDFSNGKHLERLCKSEDWIETALNKMETKAENQVNAIKTARNLFMEKNSKHVVTDKL